MKNKEYTHCNISDTILTNFNNKEEELEFIRDLFCHKGTLSYDEYYLWSKKNKRKTYNYKTV